MNNIISPFALVSEKAHPLLLVPELSQVVPRTADVKASKAPVTALTVEATGFWSRLQPALVWSVIWLLVCSIR